MTRTVFDSLSPGTPQAGAAISQEGDGLEPVEELTAAGFRCKIVSSVRPADPDAELARLLDPASSVKTLHWGRNYIYLAHLRAGPDGGSGDGSSAVQVSVSVAVKQFRTPGLRARAKRRLAGSKAAKSFEIARAMQAAGIPTPEPLLLAESSAPSGPTFYVCRHLEEVFEARYLFRAVNAGREAELFPRVDVEVFLRTLGALLRCLHDAGFWHRDMSSGNVLVRVAEGEEAGQRGPPELFLVDLNRTRRGRVPSLSERTRDLCRLMIFRPDHQQILLRAYWGGEDPGRRESSSRAIEGFEAKRRLYEVYHRNFLRKNETKKRVRGAFRRVLGGPLARVGSALKRRTAHAHIPEVPEGASSRDKVVWDPLSDQPHQHAGRFEKLKVRLADAPAHLGNTFALGKISPRIWRRFRKLKEDLYGRPVPWRGTGVSLRPLPGNPEALLSAVEDLGVRHLLLRLHPWQGDHGAEETLARELHGRGYDLAFSLPQSRSLVRDPKRWKSAVEELAERFTPYGSAFQVGQAINRSKWGLWTFGEYIELAETAAEILRRRPGVQVIGPAVIDFELYATAAVLHQARGRMRFDALASLLYVDRRGAPENRQLGFDTVDKVALLKAIADTSEACGDRSWITEVNWPLWEGPHSPAGRSVSVDEESQADFLARYYMLALGTGLVERVYWWRMIARGYGLIEPGEDGSLRRRPSFRAFAHLEKRLRSSAFEGPLEAPEGVCLYRFRELTGDELIVGWSVEGEKRAELPRPAVRVADRDGEELEAPTGAAVILVPSPRYFTLAE